MKMEIKRYRTVYRDGSYSAWSTDYESVAAHAKRFNGWVETWIVTI